MMIFVSQGTIPRPDRKEPAPWSRSSPNMANTPDALSAESFAENMEEKQDSILPSPLIPMLDKSLNMWTVGMGV